MKEPLALLNTYSSSCCCIMCMMTCACDGCYLYRNRDPSAALIANRLRIVCLGEIRRLNRDEKRLYLLNKFRTFQVNLNVDSIYIFQYSIVISRLYLIGAGHEVQEV